MEGWIKVHRKLLEWEWFGDSNVVHIFLYLLLTANQDDKRWQGIEISRGQLITSINTIAKVTNLSLQQVRTALNKLEKSGEINKESNRLYTLLTVCNYEYYQGDVEDDNKANNIPSESPEPEFVETEEYFPVEEVVSNQKSEEVTLFPQEEIKEKKDKTMLFKNSIYSDKELLASKLDPVEFKDIDFTYYYNAVFDWSELKSVKRSNNGWVATIRTWIRRDIAEGKVKKIKSSGYGVDNKNLTDFLNY